MRKLFFCYSALLFVSCSKPFPVESIQTNSAFVVEGLITDDLKRHVLRFSSSASIDSSGFIPISNADIKVLSNSGDQFQYTETDQLGVYESDVFAGEAGLSYELQIQTEDGVFITSSQVKQQKTSNIDSIFTQFTINDDGTPGVEMYINSQANSKDISRFYRWYWTETYARAAAFPSFLEWVGGEEVRSREVVYDTCWISGDNQEILVNSSVGLSENVISSFPIRFIPNNSYELSSRYSIEVTQINITSTEYEYWALLNKIADQQGSLNDLQPGEVVGNLTASDGSTVFGYFSASNATKKRVFIEPEEFEEAGYERVNPQDFCTQVYVPKGALGDFMNTNNLRFLIQIRLGPDIGSGRAEGFWLVPTFCGDCRTFGSPEKPPFWDD